MILPALQQSSAVQLPALPVLQQNNDMVWMLLALQGLWFLFLIILTWAMRRILKDIEENTKATTRVAESVQSINLLLSGNYVTKPEFDRLENRMREAEKNQVRLDNDIFHLGRKRASDPNND